MNILLAYGHYLALALGAGSIGLRATRLREAKAGGSPSGILVADNLWGIAALLWIVTGLMRAFAGFEKGSAYYLQNPWFWIKMGLFLFLFLLELWPMITFIRWRIAKKETVAESDLPTLRKFSLISRAELLLVLLIPLFAVVMARRGFF